MPARVGPRDAISHGGFALVPTMSNLKESNRKCRIFFQLLGLGVADASPRSLHWNVHISNLYIVFICMHLVFVVKYHVHIFHFLDWMGWFNDWMKYVATVLSTFVIIIESAVKRDRQMQLLEVAEACEQDMVIFFRRHELRDINRQFCGRFQRRFKFFTIWYVVSELCLVPMVFVPAYRKSAYYYLCTGIMVWICRYRHFQHILYMDKTDYLMRLVIEALKRCKTPLQVTRIQQLFRVPVQMVDLQNDFFGLSQSLNFIFNNLQLLGDTYWIYWRLLNGCCTPGFYSK